MTAFESIAQLFIKHQSDIAKLATDQANSFVIRLNLQLSRVRNMDEQDKILNFYYRQALRVLKRFEDRNIHMLPLIVETIPQAEMTLAEFGDASNKFRNVHNIKGLFDDIDFDHIKDLSFGELPEDHPVFKILKDCKDYFAHWEFFNRINELLDILATQKEKISNEELKAVRDEKVISLTAAQKVLAIHSLLNWLGVRPESGQITSHQRFIASLTGLPATSVRDKFPTGKNLSKEVQKVNLEKLIVLFESINAEKIVAKIREDLRYEEQERMEKK